MAGTRRQVTSRAQNPGRLSLPGTFCPFGRLLNRGRWAPQRGRPSLKLSCFGEGRLFLPLT